MKNKEYKSIFLKTALDTLPPHQKGVNHNIILKKDNTLLFNLLYNISLDQLEMVKDYLKNYFNKGFITYNNILYTSPIFFTKKL